jgi:hypothetical protein
MLYLDPGLARRKPIRRAIWTNPPQTIEKRPSRESQASRRSLRARLKQIERGAGFQKLFE